MSRDVCLHRAGEPTNIMAKDRTNDDGARSEGPPDEDRGRRRFLAGVSLVLGGLAATVAAIPVVGIVFTRPTRGALTWFPVGRVEDFAIGDTVKIRYRDPKALPWAGFSAEAAAWLRRESEERFVALSAYCTHVGCPVRWVAGAELFLCPCHGGAFHRDGAVAAGPPPRPLPRYPVRIRRGRVEVLPPPLHDPVRV